MYETRIDPSNLLRRFGRIASKDFNAATLQALNDSAFEVRDGWAKVIPGIFDRPTPLTMKAPLYKKATTNRLIAEVFIRNEAKRGTPPAQYLAPQVFGGQRKQKAGEKMLERAGFPKYYVPAKGAKLDAFGNIRGGTITAIMADLKAAPARVARSTERSRRQRKRRGKSGYFMPQRKGAKKPRIIFERSADGSVKPILYGVTKPPSYRPRFDAFNLAGAIFHDRFKKNFHRQLRARGIT